MKWRCKQEILTLHIFIFLSNSLKNVIVSSEGYSLLWSLDKHIHIRTPLIDGLGHTVFFGKYRGLTSGD